MCNHGQDSMFCRDCRSETRASIKAKINAGTHGYIISAFHEDGEYNYGNAINAKVYKSQAVAERICNKGNTESGFNRVVRLVKIPKESA